ncbi:MAG: TetR family transcriptional regulator [Hahellaceae bacterium]|nr:TetR family transcriptional regulator [Hahellaceae bacterium]
MVKKTREEALETRTLLLDTAEEVFHLKGVSKSTLCDIAAAAGLTRGAIYWHFKNKDDLFNAMCDRVSLPLETMTEAAASEDTTDPLGELRRSVQFFFHKVITDRHYRLVFDILFSKCEFVADLGPIVERDAQVRKQFKQRFERAFINAEKRGQLPPGLNHRLAVQSYQGFVKGIVRNWLLDPNSFDLEVDGGRMLEGFFEMLQFSKALRDE